MKKKTFNFLAAMRKNMMAAAILGMAMMMGCSVMTGCSSSSDDDGGKMDVKEYLAGKEWTINGTSGTYSYYKNHMVIYENGGGLTPGGLVIEPDVAFGYWQMDGDKLTTRFTTGRPSGFDMSGLLNGTLNGVHLQESNEMTSSKPGSVSIDMRPVIVGTLSNGGECRFRYYKQMEDVSDDTSHDAALRGTWYCSITESASGKKHVGSMTFNEDGTMHMVIEGVKDFTTTYSTRNGRVTINSYLVENHEATFYYINLYGAEIKLYSSENGYMSSIWFKDRNEI